MVLSASNLLLGQLLPENGGDGSIGVTFFGVDVGDRAGRAASLVGDVNGDGFDDILIGTSSGDAAGNSLPGAGDSYLVFGRADWSSSPSLNLGSLDGTNGFTIFGQSSYDYSGRAVSAAGDVNGDGFADLLIGARYADTDGRANSGKNYVIFGKADWSSTPTLSLATLDGTNGFTIGGIDTMDESGHAVGSVGDVNGDGYDDLLIGAPGADSVGNASENAGEGYVVFGKADWSATPTLSLASLDGTNGFTVHGLNAFDQSGFAVSGAGDINGDGFDDVLIGTPMADGPGNAVNVAGESYVIFGKADWTSSPSVNVSSLNGSNGFTVYGINAVDRSGISVSTAGDVNGDGFDDLLIGADYADGDGNAVSEAGEAYVVFGKADWTATPTLQLGVLNGINGFTLFGGKPTGQAGWSVSGSGDLNGDGFDDIVIGAFDVDLPNDATADVGESYVVFGRADWSLTSTLNLSGLDGISGFTLYGVDIRDYSGWAVSSRGDTNGDGFDDLLIGASRADGSANGVADAGEAYLIFGGDFLNSTTHPGTPDADVLTGTAAADIMHGGRGNDTLTGNGGADVIHGGLGDDIIRISDTQFSRIDGGNGTDTLVLVGSGMLLELTALPNNGLLNIEEIDVRGNGGNTLVLNALEVLNLSQTSNTLTVLADPDDTVHIGSGWVQTMGAIAGIPSGFVVLKQGAATLILPAAVAPPNVSLSLSSSVIAEAGGTSAVTATLSAIADTDVTIELAYSGTATNSLDYNRSATEIVIPAGSLSGFVTLTAIPDSVVEPLETIIVDIVFVTNASEAGQQQVVATIASLLPPQIIQPATETNLLRPAITWTEVAGATGYEIWVNNQTTGVRPYLRADSVLASFTPASDMGIGLYNLWVRAINSQGEVSPYNPQHNFRVNPGVVFQPFAHYQTTAAPVLSWLPLPGAARYDIWIDNRSTGQSEFIRDTALTTTSWSPISPMPMGSYRVWVRGFDEGGIAARWSRAMDFFVVPPVVPVSSSDSTFYRTPSFSWNSLPGAIAYDFTLHDLNSGAVISSASGLTITSFTQPTDLPVSTYRWQVYAVGPGGLRSQGAVPNNLFVGGRPSIIAPAGSTTDTTPTFFWSEVDGAVSYSLYVSRIDTPAAGMINLTGLAANNYTPAANLAPGSYRFWVRAVSYSSEVSPWSLQRDFTILSAIDELPEPMASDAWVWQSFAVLLPVSSGIVSSHAETTEPDGKGSWAASPAPTGRPDTENPPILVLIPGQAGPEFQPPHMDEIVPKHGRAR